MLASNGGVPEVVGRIKKGSTIFTSKPFSYVLNSKFRTERCDNCLKSGKLFKCSSCKCIYYCNRVCQKESWSVHRGECGNLKRVSPKVVPDAARLMARIIVKLNTGGGEELDYYTQTNYRKFKDLMSHYSDLKQDQKRMEHFISLCGVLFEYLGETLLPNSAELIGIFGRICINSFDILDENMNSIGVGIYLGPSILDHSCVPNAVAVFEGTTIMIRTLEDMPCLDLSQVRISYIDLLNTTKDRRDQLKRCYYFWCECQRCQEPEPNATAAACPNSTCTNPCKPDSETCCSQCGQELSPEFKQQFNDVTEFTAYHLQNMKTMAYLDVSKVCLKKQEGILHPLNIQRVRTLESAYEAAIKLNHYSEGTEDYAKQLIPGYLFYYGETHPLVGLLYLSLGRLELYIGKSKKALETLKKAQPILEITHGKNHLVVREALKPFIYQAAVEARL